MCLRKVKDEVSKVLEVDALNKLFNIFIGEDKQRSI